MPDSHRNQGADKQPGTGAGNEEGIKEIIRAEQLEAMGKLDAIFGKRAQNIAGEFTAEATQGPQQLKTNYQQRRADHIDVHAKAERDEVPVAFQDYVQRYFELVKDAALAGKGFTTCGYGFHTSLPDCEIKQRMPGFRIEVNVGRELLGSHDQAAVLAPNVPAVPEDHDSIWRAVDRIRNSSTMSGCNRLVQLLRFVVGSTLKGEASYLKETTIGVAVFGRSPDYDPKVDTIVRSQAWRLRSKLKKYYSTEGIEDPVVIDLPLGALRACLFAAS